MKTKKETADEAYERGRRVALLIALQIVQDAPPYSKAYSLRNHLVNALNAHLKA